MSLFKICNWWSVKCADITESYDSYSLLVCRFGIFENEKDFVVIGSHNGNLSIYYPNYEYDNKDDKSKKENDFNACDLLLETKLKDPIINLAAGKFNSSNIDKSENNNQLAILQPNNIAIYNLSTTNGNAEHGSQFTLQSVIKHKFLKTAFYMCKGPFGGIKGRDFICIGHLDGSLTFYEQEGIAYECELPGSKSIPFTMYYISRTDSFIRTNFSWELESFSYQDVSQSHITKSKIDPIWTVCLGEFVLDICPVQTSNNETAIMILGEHNLFNITDDGRLKYLIKLDFIPKCFHSFLLGYYFESNTRHLNVIISESGSIVIYEQTKLIWAAQLEESPVSIKRSNIKNLPGAIVTLGAFGSVKIGYLGSEPLNFKVPILNLEELNFENAHKELLQLELEIKNGIDLTDVQMINNTAKNDIEINFNILPILENCIEDTDISDLLKNKSDPLQMCKGIFKFKTNINLHQIQIAFILADGLKCSRPVIVLNNVSENTSHLIELYFYMIENVHISTIKVEAYVSFINKQGIPRILMENQLLPLNLFYKQCSAQKDATNKVTLTINEKSTIKLSQIFSKVCTDNDIQHLGLMSLYNNEMVTIIAAKNSNRFRIQSEEIESLTPILETIIFYLENLKNKHENSQAKPDLSNIRKSKKLSKIKTKHIIIAPQIPSNEILVKISEHNLMQENIRNQTSYMDNLWNQFKLFQRSLQSKPPEAPTDGLMMLIEKNYDDLIIEGDKLIEMKTEERSKRANLSCAISLLNYMISYMNLEETIIELVTSTLSFPIEDWTEKYWEEVIDSSLNMLHNHEKLSNKIGKSKKIISSNPNDGVTISNIIPYEFDRFKRHFLILCERISKIASESGKQNTKISFDENFKENPGEKPISESEQDLIEDNENNDEDTESLDKTKESDWTSNASISDMLILKIT